MRAKNVVVLLSGGLDSTVCASIAKGDGSLLCCVFVNYGQPAMVQELEASSSWCLTNNVELIYVTAGIDCEQLYAGTGERGARVVPGRNGVLISLAVACASRMCPAEDKPQVWIGCSAQDEVDYPDCRPDYIRAVSDLSLATYGVSVSSPLLNFSRKAVTTLAKSLNVMVHKCWSCYEPSEGKPCGTCNSCTQMESSQSSNKSPKN